MGVPVKAILFDVYGTLLDVHGVAATGERLFPGQGAALSALWRTRQIDYTRLRTLSGRYADFARVTADALDYALEALGLAADAAARQQLVAAYETLPAFADAGPALAGLKAGGVRLGVLSNGTPHMLSEGLGAVGLLGLFEQVLSVEAAQAYKTSPAAYRLGPAALGLPAAQIGFVSSNGWDIAGAGWFGFRTFWVNRRGEPPERLGIAPEATGASLADLAAWAAG